MTAVVDIAGAAWQAVPVDREDSPDEGHDGGDSAPGGDVTETSGPQRKSLPYPYSPPKSRTSDLHLIDWPMCEVEGCLGVSVAGRTTNNCLGHLAPEQAGEHIEQREVDLRGVEVSEHLAKLISERLTRRTRGIQLSMKRAKVLVPLALDGLIVTSASFELAEFEGELSCKGTTFSEDVSFVDAELGGGATLAGATFEKGLDFTRCRSYGDVDLSNSVLEKPTALGDLYLSDGHVLVLDGISARGQVDLSVGVIVWHESRTSNLVQVGVSCYRSEFADGLHLSVTETSVLLERTTFGSPSVVWAPGDYGDKSQLLSLWGTDCGNLTISNLKLTHCRFAGGVNLDKLRIDGPVLLPITPRGWSVHATSMPPFWRWTKRLCLYDEYAWRVEPFNWRRPTDARRAAWSHTLERLPKRLASHRPYRDEAKAAQLASAYRALRKSREDAKDEPGAGDFYYGEMEMRRRSSGTYWSERLLLHLYWLVSAYGQRSARAFTLLLVVLLGSAWWLSIAGFPTPRSYGDSLLFAVQAVIGLTPSVPLSTTGEVVRILVKILVPVLAGLGLLAVRGRVKR